MIIGVLSLQGSFKEHKDVIEATGDTAIEVKEPKDLSDINGLIIPGGESTTLIKLLRIKQMDRAIIKAVESGLVIWGTCAGLILLSFHLKLIDIEVERNSYGSQLDSFTTKVNFNFSSYDVKFIRAPRIISIGKGVIPLSTYRGSIVAAENKNIIVTSFHSEVTNSIEFYNYFKRKIDNF